MSNIKELSTFILSEGMRAKFDKVLQGNSNAFLSNMLTVVNSSYNLQKCSKESIYNAALMAASLGLSLDKNLGHAYIIPYKDQAQFQLGYKGLIQLCQRTNQFSTIGATPIYEGQIVRNNPLTGYEFDFDQPEKGEPIGYAASFSLLNGFHKIDYWTKEKVENHAKEYSKSYYRSDSIWKKNFKAMALKTVLKNMLDKYAPVAVDLQAALTADQAVINDVQTLNVQYVDNEPISLEETLEIQEMKNISEYIDQCDDLEMLDVLKEEAEKYDLLEIYNAKIKQLSPVKNGKGKGKSTV